MMEEAGRGTALAIQRRLGAKHKRVIVLVGPGNNGGDGLVAAHYLWEMGARVTCYMWKRNPTSDPNFERVKADNLPLIWVEDDGDFEALRGLISGADVIIDALLGVGVSRPIEGLLKDLLTVAREAIEARRAPDGLAEACPALSREPAPLVVGVDCPTGLDCDTGAVDEATLPADLTVTFAYPKVGLLRFPGAGAVGNIIVADIGIPPKLADDVRLEMATAGQVRDWLPERPPSAHKGTFGRALIVAGSANYVGAAALAGAGAVRVGTGLVTMALPLPIQAAVAANLTEATYLLLPHDMGVVASGAVEVLQRQMADYTALLLGPGLTQEKETVVFVHRFLGLESADRKGRLGFVASSPATEAEHGSVPPLVVDADGLNALAQANGWWRALPAGTILTPHPGEMARLMGGDSTAGDVQADREGLALRMAEQWGVVIVLKGALTVVSSPDGRQMILPFANSGLATAGSGDVLAGAITGLRAQGMDAYEAAVAGAYLHGLAGELVRSELGDMGMAAGDLPPRLPQALQQVRCARSSQ
jgi:NAD(P)H-hydrate epimerase